MNLKNQLMIRFIADSTLALGLLAIIVLSNLSIPLKILMGIWFVIELIAVYRSIRKFLEMKK